MSHEDEQISLYLLSFKVKENRKEETYLFIKTGKFYGEESLNTEKI